MSFEYDFFNYLNNVRNTYKIMPLNLGGYTGASGGAGGPPGGYVGFLPQLRVAYDTSELASSATPTISASLLDNLNHIRYRITSLESGNVSGKITVLNSGVVVASGIDELDFVGGSVTTSGTRATITFSGTGSSTTVSNVPTTLELFKVNGSLVTLSGADVPYIVCANYLISGLFCYISSIPSTSGTLLGTIRHTKPDGLSEVITTFSYSNGSSSSLISYAFTNSYIYTGSIVNLDLVCTGSLFSSIRINMLVSSGSVYIPPITSSGTMLIDDDSVILTDDDGITLLED